VLYRFSGGADGWYPFPVILDSAGNLYGATIWGGSPNCQGHGNCGVVFKLDTAGKFSVLHSFTGGKDGTNPESQLVMDTAGNLYGTTVAGGAGGGCLNQNPPGCGTVFKLDKDGNETVLHAFNGEDGADPSAGLLLDRDGTIYGATIDGGTYATQIFADQSICCHGTIFKLDKRGRVTVLHSFTGLRPDNGVPYDGLIEDDKGILYGTTEFHPPGSNIFGTVFSLNKKGGPVSELFTFDLEDGGYPVAGLIRDNSGNLYGTTLGGGHGCQCGTVFKLDPQGRETILHKFTQKTDGAAPQSILVRDDAGNLYGTALYGAHHNGVVFKITP